MILDAFKLYQERLVFNRGTQYFCLACGSLGEYNIFANFLDHAATDFATHAPFFALLPAGGPKRNLSVLLREEFARKCNMGALTITHTLSNLRNLFVQDGIQNRNILYACQICKKAPQLEGTSLDIRKGAKPIPAQGVERDIAHICEAICSHVPAYSSTHVLFARACTPMEFSIVLRVLLGGIKSKYYHISHGMLQDGMKNLRATYPALFADSPALATVSQAARHAKPQVPAYATIAVPAAMPVAAAATPAAPALPSPACASPPAPPAQLPPPKSATPPHADLALFEEAHATFLHHAEARLKIQLDAELRNHSVFLSALVKDAQELSRATTNSGIQWKTEVAAIKPSFHELEDLLKLRHAGVLQMCTDLLASARQQALHSPYNSASNDCTRQVTSIPRTW